MISILTPWLFTACTPATLAYSTLPAKNKASLPTASSCKLSVLITFSGALNPQSFEVSLISIISTKRKLSALFSQGIGKHSTWERPGGAWGDLSLPAWSRLHAAPQTHLCQLTPCHKKAHHGGNALSCCKHSALRYRELEASEIPYRGFPHFIVGLA